MTTQQTIDAQNLYCGLNLWHAAGFNGNGIIVWNTESLTSEHGDIVQRRITDAAPGATVLRAGMSVVSNGTQVLTHTCNYNGVEYDIEDFIDAFNIKVITRSIGGGAAEGTPVSAYWNSLKNTYNLIFFNSASNDGTGDGETTGGSFPPDVAYWIAACNLMNGNPVRANYSSVGHDVDFINFTGIWSGTSFAAPYTAGEAALVKSRYGINLTSEEVFRYLKMISKDLTANGVGFDNYSGWGIPRFRAVNKTYITLDVGNTNYKVDGVNQTMDTCPVNVSGSIFVPLRVIAEGLGKTITWVKNANNSITITITDGTNTIVITTGSTTMTKNGTAIVLTTAPYIDVNGRTLVPVRAIAEAFNCDVDWIQNLSRVMILEK